MIWGYVPRQACRHDCNVPMERRGRWLCSNRLSLEGGDMDTAGVVLGGLPRSPTCSAGRSASLPWSVAASFLLHYGD